MHKDYYARIAARFLKDPLISPDAKLLRTVLAAFADQRTGRTFVSLRRIERLMRCGRKRRSAAQNELVAAGMAPTRARTRLRRPPGPPDLSSLRTTIAPRDPTGFASQSR